MTRNGWANRRQVWAERQQWSEGKRHERIDAEYIGAWPEAYQKEDGEIIVTGLYFPPKSELIARWISLAVTVPPVLIVACWVPNSWDWYIIAVLLFAIGGACWLCGQLLAFRWVAKRLIVEFLPDGSLRGQGFAVRALDDRSFDANEHPFGRDEQLREDQIIRAKGSKASPQPRYYRDACRVRVVHGGGNMHRDVVADIGADAHHTLGTKLRGVLEEMNARVVNQRNEKVRARRTHFD